MSGSGWVNRNVLLLAQGQLVNQAGTQIALCATVFWLKRSTDSAGLVGLMTAASALPLLLLGPLGGACADRWSRRNILIALDLFGGIVSSALALLLQVNGSAAATAFGTLLLALFLGNILLASAIPFTTPAVNALIPSLVPASRLESAMAFFQASGFAAMIAGQLLGGLLLVHYAPPVLFWINAGSYFLSALAEMFVRPDARPAGAHLAGEPVWRQMTAGISYVWRNRGMRALFLAAIPLNLFTTPVIVFLPFYATNALGQPLERYGYLLAALSCGLLLGYAIGGTVRPAGSKKHVVLFGCVAACATVPLLLAVTVAFWVALLLLVVLGGLLGVVTLTALSSMVGKTEPGKRGRVGALLLMTTQGVSPLLVSLMGAMQDALRGNVRLMYGGCGLVLGGVAAAFYSNRDLRRFLEEPAALETPGGTPLA